MVTVKLFGMLKTMAKNQAELRVSFNGGRTVGDLVGFLERDYPEGSGMKFETYEGMAQKKLREIRERALKDFDVIEILIVHRYGDIQIGENIVLVIAAAEHRGEAFRACKWSIDELKQITPIWKLESTPQGEVWVEEHPCAHSR